MTDRSAQMMAEYEEIPADVRQALEDAGFEPMLDAGNLWFLDRGNSRLVFGEDGSDLPQSLNEPVTVCRKDIHDDFGVDFDALAVALIQA